jgi:amino acid adenylation domain-containing protein
MVCVPECTSVDHRNPLDRPFEPFPASALQGSIIDRFDEIVRRHSSRLAVSDVRGNNLAYAELAHLVDRIATATAVATASQLGPVAILLPSDAYFPAAVLGVLATGRGYVPLDPSAAPERNRLIALQSGAAAVISIRELAGRMQSVFPERLPIVAIDALGKATGTFRRRPGPNDISFIIYTSGSTGKPKGVYQNHRNLLHSIMQATNDMHLNYEDRMTLARSPSFIGATRDALLALLNGASLHVLPPLELEPIGLVEEIRARHITILRTSPTLLRRIAEVLDRQERLDSVRLVVLVSERAEWSDFDIFRRIFSPDAYLMVRFGFTEGNATRWFVDEAARASTTRLPVGRALADLNVSIVDDYGCPVLVGDVGELVVAGRYLALGYWRDPESTARAFSVDPTDPKLRIYKTGDLGRWRPDGLLEHLGRKDDQIKLHGHRIEPAEIERALRECAGVADAAVVARRNENGIVRSLAVYVEIRPSVHELSPRDLRSMLKRYLPPYMIPATINLIDHLPRLSNLKTDRKAIAQIDATRAAQLVNPSNDPLVAELIGIFESVLGDVGATSDDNISTLGGDSLQAVKVALEMEQRFGRSIPVEVFESTQTIRELARWLSVQQCEN